jgi:hypothetical protein
MTNQEIANIITGTDGRQYRLTQDPFASGGHDGNGAFYEAGAECLSHEGGTENQYTIYWAMRDENADDDEYNADWDNPTGIWHYLLGWQ